MTGFCSVCKLIHFESRALAGDRRAAAGFDLVMILAASVVSAMQVAALVGGSLQQTFAQVTNAMAGLTGG